MELKGATTNRNKLIEIFISNLANAVIHRILEKAIDEQEIANAYNKEIKNSWKIAKRYREKINPANRNLPENRRAYTKLNLAINNIP